MKCGVTRKRSGTMIRAMYKMYFHGNLINGVQTDLQVQTDSQEPKPTSAITQNFNLNSTSLRPALIASPCLPSPLTA